MPLFSDNILALVETTNGNSQIRFIFGYIGISRIVLSQNHTGLVTMVVLVKASMPVSFILGPLLGGKNGCIKYSVWPEPDVFSGIVIMLS